MGVYFFREWPSTCKKWIITTTTVLVQELKESRERIVEMQRQVQAGPIPMVSNLSISGSPDNTGGGKGSRTKNKKMKLKAIEDIYSPLSASGALPKINKGSSY